METPAPDRGSKPCEAGHEGHGSHPSKHRWKRAVGVSFGKSATELSWPGFGIPGEGREGRAVRAIWLQSSGDQEKPISVQAPPSSRWRSVGMSECAKVRGATGICTQERETRIQTRLTRGCFSWAERGPGAILAYQQPRVPGATEMLPFQLPRRWVVLMRAAVHPLGCGQLRIARCEGFSSSMAGTSLTSPFS